MKNNIIAVIFIISLLPAIAGATLSGKKLCVDPGHGGADPGATGVNGESLPNEADLVLDVDSRFKGKLENDFATVVMTRVEDVEISLENRVAIANDNAVNLFLSTHLNSADDASAHGTETYAYSQGGNGEALANFMQTELISHLAKTDRGVKFNNYYVIRYTTMPAILSEGLFVSNQSEFDYISLPASRDEHAKALYHAVCAYYGVTPKDDSVITTPGSVKGFVYNATTGLGNVTGNRIADASVTLTPVSGNSFTATSSTAGLFTFSSVDPGDYTLKIEKTGFDTAEKQINVAGGAETWASTGINEIAKPDEDSVNTDDTVIPDETADEPADETSIPDDDEQIISDETVQADEDSAAQSDNSITPDDTVDSAAISDETADSDSYPASEGLPKKDIDNTFTGDSEIPDEISSNSKGCGCVVVY